MSNPKKQALYEHVRALRRTIVVSAAAIALLFLVLFYTCCDPLVNFVLLPVRARGIDIISTAVSEALLIQFKVCLIAALIAASPVVIWQVWSFVAPALYPHEKRLAVGLFVVSLLLFLAGVGFCYLYVFPLAINLFWAAADTVAPAMWSVQEYFDFVLAFILPFGLMFELPVVMFVLAKRGLVDYPKLAKWRKYVVLLIAVLAAVLTPPDVVSQCMLGLPMYLLYELTAQLTRFVKPKAAEA